MKNTKIAVGLYDKNFEKPEDLEGRIHEVSEFFRKNVDAGHGSVSDGYWMGSREKAYVFECVNLEDYLVRHDSVEGLVEELREVFEQDSIPIIREKAEIVFIDGESD